MSIKSGLDRSLVLGAVRTTEAAAIAASRMIGLGDEKNADQVAVDAMRKMLGDLDISGVVVIGEGERDEAPMLFIGEKIGKGGNEIDIALDPLEGTTITANGGPNALAVLAMSEKGGFLHAPDVYMDKIAVGGNLPPDIVDLDFSPSENINRLAEAKGTKPSDLMACVLDRPRHAKIIEEIRGTGARIKLIPDGDVAGVIATSDPETGVDIYIGVGGAPEGVLAAAALTCIGGQMQGRLVFRNDIEKSRAASTGIKNLEKKYKLNDLAHGDVLFAASGVTDGSMLDGVKQRGNYVTTHSMVMRAKTGTIRKIHSQHDINKALMGVVKL